MTLAVQKPVISTHRGQQVVLGRRHVSPPVVGPRRMLAHRLMESLPPPPPAVDWAKAAMDQGGGDLGMMLNDRLGCCTIAAVGHAVQIWTANTGKMVTPTDNQILDGYEKVDGYNPADPGSDQGGIETEVLGAWQRTGVAGSQIDAWVPINGMNLDHVRKAIFHFGLVYVGIALPNTTANQDGEWTLDIGAGADAEAGSRGGHAVILPKYDPDRFGMITWGGLQDESVDFEITYTDELYAPFCKALWCRNGNSPLGESAQALLAALEGVA